MQRTQEAGPEIGISNTRHITLCIDATITVNGEGPKQTKNRCTAVRIIKQTAFTQFMRLGSFVSWQC